MAVETRRGCGYRKIGGLYFVGGGRPVYCDRLPIPLEICPVCKHGIKQTRAFTWVHVEELVGGLHPDCKDDFPCPLCMIRRPATSTAKAAALGVSRRISAIPRGFKVGETWILFAHPKTIETFVEVEVEQGAQGEFPATALAQRRVYKPGIFRVWKPERIEKILPESARGSAEARERHHAGFCSGRRSRSPRHGVRQRKRRGGLMDTSDKVFCWTITLIVVPSGCYFLATTRSLWQAFVVGVLCTACVWVTWTHVAESSRKALEAYERALLFRRPFVISAPPTRLRSN